MPQNSHLPALGFSDIMHMYIVCKPSVAIAISKPVLIVDFVQYVQA